MFRKMLILTAIILVFAASNLQAEQIHSTWVGGARGEWENPINWSPPIVPDNNATNTFAVTIDAGTDKINVILSTNVLPYGHVYGHWTIDSMRCYGEVEFYLTGLQYGPAVISLLDPNGLTNYGDFCTSAWGTLLIEINGNVNNTAGGLLDFWGATIGGDLNNPADARAEINGDVRVKHALQNAGHIFVAPDHGLEAEGPAQNAGQITVLGGTFGANNTLDNNSPGLISGFGVLYGGDSLTNKGTIYATGGPLAVGTAGSISNSGILGNAPLALMNIKHLCFAYTQGLLSDVNNSGTIEVNAGGGVAFDCNLVNKPDGIIKLLGGTLAATTITQKADANFTGFGSITGDVVIDPDGLIKLTGPANIIGDVNIPAGATLKISDGQTLITGHTTCNGTIHLIGGTVIFQGGCDCDGCNIINEAGTDRNHFDINADGIEDFKDFAEFANNWLWQASWY
jgi:hypothetical protein